MSFLKIANPSPPAVSFWPAPAPYFRARAAASILGDEAMHLAVLRQALGENPVPWAFVS